MPSRSASVALCLSLVLGLTAIGWWLVVSNPGVQAFMFTSDQLTLPSLADDILRNPDFSIFTWNLPRAPYLFPDFLVYLVVRRLVGDTFVAIYVHTAFYLAALAIGALLVCRRAFAAKATGDLALVMFCLLSILVLVLASRAWPWVLVAWPFLGMAHGTCALAALYMFLFYERIADRGALFWHVIGWALCAALMFSDKLFFFYFSLPYAFVLLFDRPLRRMVINLAVFGFSQAAALAAGWVVGRIVSLQVIDRPSLRIIQNLKNVWRALRDFSVPSHWLFLVVAVAAAIALALIGARRGDSDPPINRRVALFVGGIILFGAAISVVLWPAPVPPYARYAAGFEMGALVGIAFLTALSLRRLTPQRVSFAGILVLVCLGLWQTYPKSVAAPFIERHHMQAAFAACRDTYRLQAGWASYWVARKLTITLDWATQVNQFEPDIPVPFLWGSNARWFSFPLESQEPIVYNFVIDQDLKRDDILLRFGAPSKEADCGGFRLLLYDAPDVLRFRG